MYPRRNFQEKLTPGECLRGVALSVLYLLLFPFAMAWVQHSAGVELPVAEANVVYHLVSVLLVFLLFWRFLKQNFALLLDRLPENLTAAAAGLLGWIVLDTAVRLLPLPVSDPNEAGYAAEYFMSPGATVMILVVLMPIAEEMIFRGFLFGTLRRYSRGMAYVCSAGCFALCCVWQFIYSYGGTDLRYLLLAVRYLPAGLALSWCYDWGSSLWSAVLLHMAMNGLTLLRVTAG